VALTAAPMDSSLSEPEVLGAAAPSDRGAQRAVFERLTTRVRRVAHLVLHDRADADDAAQLALLKILDSTSPRAPSEALEDWAERIAIGVALQYSKRERRRQTLLQRWLVPGRLPWGQDTQSYPLEAPSLEEAVRRLNPAQREAFVLRHILEYTVPEIAELTRTPTGTVKNRLLSARKSLRRLFKGQGGAPRLVSADRVDCQQVSASPR
jgi:RNA polymerase sigma-70 factor, ECF subfamily